jgi:hypothetical protein
MDLEKIKKKKIIDKELEIFGDIWRPKGYTLVKENNQGDLFTKFTYKPNSTIFGPNKTDSVTFKFTNRGDFSRGSYYKLRETDLDFDDVFMLNTVDEISYLQQKNCNENLKSSYYLVIDYLKKYIERKRMIKILKKIQKQETLSSEEEQFFNTDDIFTEDPTIVGGRRRRLTRRTKKINVRRKSHKKK